MGKIRCSECGKIKMRAKFSKGQRRKKGDNVERICIGYHNKV